MKKEFFLLLAFFVFLSSSFKDVSFADGKKEIPVLDLRQCIEKAIEKDPDLNNVKDQIDIGRLRKNEAKWALFLPRVDLETSYGPKLDFFGRPVVTEDIYRSSLTIEKPIYKGRELITTYKLAKSEIARAHQDYNQKAIDVIKDTIEKYYKLLSAQEDLRYYKALYKQAEQSVDLLNKKFRLGAAIRMDVLEAEAKLNEIRYELVKAQGDIQEAMASLNEAIGLDPGIKIRVVKEFPFEPIKGNLEELTSLAFRERSDLLYEREDLEFNRLRLRLNKSKELPSVTLKGSYSWEGDSFPGEDSEWAVMVTLSYSFHNSTVSSDVSQNKQYKTSYNFARKASEYDVSHVKLSIFDGSSNKVNLRRAMADYTLSANRLAKLKRTIKKDVRNAFNKLREAEATIETTKTSIDYAKEKVRILEEKLKSDEATLVDLLEAKSDLVEATVKYQHALYERSVAIGSLYGATGKILEWKEKKK